MTRVSHPERRRRGEIAEDLAADYLRLLGWQICDRNVRVGGGEIDLIARKEEWLLFVEVRLRSARSHGHPIETICGRKARALTRAARAYVAAGIGDATCWRFDAVTIQVESEVAIRIEAVHSVVHL